MLHSYMTFDYSNKVINVSSTVGADNHEFDTYKYIDDKLMLIEKDVDSGDGRKKYRLIGNKFFRRKRRGISPNFA